VTTSSDPEQIRREIERTQANLSQDVDALTDKVTPSKIVERRVDRARDTVGRLKDKVMGDNPTNSGQHLGGGVQGAASTATDRVSETASSAASSVQDAASTAAGAVQEAPRAIRRQTRGNPLAAGLIAFGAGWLVSSLLPASRREQELGDQAKQVAQEKVQPVVQQVASEVGDNLREPAQQAVASVRSTAQDAKDTVAEEGRAATQDVSGRAQDAAGTVRSSTNSG
jgi:Protein of unknown function (DUF3618)